MSQYKFNLLKKAYQIYDYVNIYNNYKTIAFVIRESSDENVYKEWKEILKTQGINVKLLNTRVISSVLQKDFAASLLGNQLYILYTNTCSVNNFVSTVKKNSAIIIPISYIIDGISLTVKEAEQLITFPVANKVIAYEQTLIMPTVEIISWLENKNEEQ